MKMQIVNGYAAPAESAAKPKSAAKAASRGTKSMVKTKSTAKTRAAAKSKSPAKTEASTKAGSAATQSTARAKSPGKAGSTPKAKSNGKASAKSARAAKSASAAKSPKANADSSASAIIDQQIRDLGGWRGEALARMRKLIQEADPEVVEELKWRGTPVWSHDGIVCTGESYKTTVKLTFARGAVLPDPSRLFNSSLEGNLRRAIDIREGEQVDASAFKTLVRAAVAHNRGMKKR